MVVPIHDGTVLLGLGNGIFAAIHGRRHGSVDAPVVAAVAIDFDHELPSGALQAPLPEGLTFRGRGWAVDITFLNSPLLGGT